MYSIAICDDDRPTCLALEKMVKECSAALRLPAEISVYWSGESLIESMRRGIPYDFIILDIQLTEMTGLDVGKDLRDIQKNFHTQIIFISCKQSYAMNLFSVQPLTFLVKPVRKEELVKALSRGREMLEHTRDLFTYKSGRQMFSVSCDEILYLMSRGRQVLVICRNETLEYYGKLSDEIKQLPAAFIRIHNSYVINLNAVIKSTGSYVVMLNGDQISISRKYGDVLNKALLLNWKKMKGGL